MAGMPGLQVRLLRWRTDQEAAVRGSGSALVRLLAELVSVRSFDSAAYGRQRQGCGLGGVKLGSWLLHRKTALSP